MLQCNNPKMILFWLSYFAFVQGFVCNGIVNINLSSIEKRFDLKSEEVSYVPISYNIAAGLLVLPMTYFGTHGNKPKLLSLGALIMCLGSFIMSMPHFISGNYKQGSLSLDLCDSTPQLNMCVQSELSGYLYVLILGQFFHGIGGTILYTLGYVYLDDNLSTSDAPFYQSVMLTAACLGPAVGYLSGGQFLKIYVDFITVGVNDIQVKSTNPGWVGAWWVGFLISGILLVPAIVMLFSLPKLTPAGKLAKDNKDNQIHDGGKKNVNDEFLKTWRQIPSALMELVKNPVLMLAAAAIVVETMFVNIFNTFGAKILENKFFLSASTAALNTGLAAIPGAVIGNLLGGFIVKKLNLKIRGMLRLCMISTILCCILCGFAFLSCDTVSIAGVTVPYKNANSIDLNSQCNEKCNCTTYTYKPICGRDRIQYFSPCHAGCDESYQIDNDTEVFANCACIGPPEDGPFIHHTNLAENHPCESNCSSFYVYIVLFFIFVVLVCTATVPLLNVILRCIPESHRSFGLGVTAILTRFLGTIPGHIIIGSFFDKYCTVWQETCNPETGSCWIYDNKSFGSSLFVICLVLKLLSFSIFCVTHLVYIRPKDVNDVTASPSTNKCYDSPAIAAGEEIMTHL